HPDRPPRRSPVMKRTAIPLCAALFVFAALAVSARGTAPQPEKQVYTLHHVEYPDGTAGQAIVSVDFDAGRVTVEYYNNGWMDYLGQYREPVANDTYPRDRYEAERIAIVHFYDKS